jgi:hypothetical protein
MVNEILYGCISEPVRESKARNLNQLESHCFVLATPSTYIAMSKAR